MLRKGHIQQILQVGRANCMYEFGDHRLTPVDSKPRNYMLVCNFMLNFHLDIFGFPFLGCSLTNFSSNFNSSVFTIISWYLPLRASHSHILCKTQNIPRRLEKFHFDIHNLARNNGQFLIFKTVFERLDFCPLPTDLLTLNLFCCQEVAGL